MVLEGCDALVVEGARERRVRLGPSKSQFCIYFDQHLVRQKQYVPAAYKAHLGMQGRPRAKRKEKKKEQTKNKNERINIVVARRRRKGWWGVLRRGDDVFLQIVPTQFMATVQRFESVRNGPAKRWNTIGAEVGR
jgi:hypothetical protein